MDLCKFSYGDYEYDYFLIKEDRKTLRLTVYPNLKIVLYVPLTCVSDTIESFLKRKALWLKKQVADLNSIRRSGVAREYVSGESVLYLGRQYKLVVEKANVESVHFEHGRIVIKTLGSVDDSVLNMHLLEQWYLERAEFMFAIRYKEMFKKFNYDFVPELALRKMKRRWGSFLTRKKILLNPELIKASKECIDYVILHELCHMRYQNHSAAYYKFLASKCPNWKSVKGELELRFADY